MRILVVAGAALVAAAAVGCSDPSQPEHWVEKLKDLRERKEAVHQLANFQGRCKAQGTCEHVRDVAVPALAALFEEEHKPEVLQTLIAFHDKRALPLLLKAVGSDDAAVAAPAATELGELGDPSAVEPLVAVAAKPVAKSSPGEVVKANVLKALGRLHDERAVDALIEIVDASPDEQNVNLHRLGALALGQIASPRAAPALVRCLFVPGPGGGAFQHARAALAAIGEPAVEPLLTAFQEHDKELQKLAREREFDKYTPGVIPYKAAYVLGDLRAKKAVPALLARLGEEPRGDMRVGILYALGSIGDLQATGAIVAILKSATARPNDRVAAAEALNFLGDLAAAPALLELAQAPSGGDDDLLKVRVAAAMAYSRLGGAAEAAAFVPVAKAETEARDVYQEAAARLGVAQQCKAVVGCYVAALGDPQLVKIEKAAIMLARLHDKAAVGPLVKLAAHAEPLIRFSVLHALSHVADRSSTEALERLQQLIDTEGSQATKQDFVHEMRVVLARLKRS